LETAKGLQITAGESQIGLPQMQAKDFEKLHTHGKRLQEKKLSRTLLCTKHKFTLLLGMLRAM
jgi:hypothetical protein